MGRQNSCDQASRTEPDGDIGRHGGSGQRRCWGTSVRRGRPPIRVVWRVGGAVRAPVEEKKRETSHTRERDLRTGPTRRKGLEDGWPHPQLTHSLRRPSNPQLTPVSAAPPPTANVARVAHLPGPVGSQRTRLAAQCLPSDRAGLRRIRFHDLRHSCATLLYGGTDETRWSGPMGTPVEIVSRAVGPAFPHPRPGAGRTPSPSA